MSTPDGNLFSEEDPRFVIDGPRSPGQVLVSSRRTP